MDDTAENGSDGGGQPDPEDLSIRRPLDQPAFLLHHQPIAVPIAVAE